MWLEALRVVLEGCWVASLAVWVVVVAVVVRGVKVDLLSFGRCFFGGTVLIIPGRCLGKFQPTRDDVC